MSTRSARFRGWGPEALEFFERLEADNTRTFWSDNRATYEEAVRAPMEALSDEVAQEFGELHIFRPYRDVRFSRDKTPYKTHIGAVTESEEGALYYVQLSAAGLMAASGYHQMSRDQVERFRTAVDDERTGPELVEIMTGLRRGFEVGGEELKTAPRGYRRDHPRVQYLRHKGLTIARSWEPASWFSTARARTNIVGAWRAADPVNAWLNANVGPSTEPPYPLAQQ